MAYESICDLTWASKWIIQGGVIAACLPHEAEEGMPGVYRDFVLAVDKVYRGQPRDRFVIRRDFTFSGRAESEAEKLVGVTAMFFLRPEREGVISPVGGPQGVWELRDDRIWSGTCCSIIALMFPEFEQAVAYSLAEAPSQHM